MNYKKFNVIKLSALLSSYYTDLQIINDNLKDLKNTYMDKNMIGIKLDDEFKENIFNKETEQNNFYVNVNVLETFMNSQILWYEKHIEQILEILYKKEYYNDIKKD